MTPSSVGPAESDAVPHSPQGASGPAFDERDGAPRGDRSDAGAGDHALFAPVVDAARRLCAALQEVPREPSDAAYWCDELEERLYTLDTGGARGINASAASREVAERDPTGPGGPPAAGDDAEGQR